jgi:maltose O-acetyltransferase
MVRRIARIVALVLFFGLARYLPRSFSGIDFGLSNRFRVALCRLIFKRCSKATILDRGVGFGHGFNIELGNYSGIGVNAMLDGTGGIVIGNNVMIASEVVILTANHKHDDITIPIMQQGEESVPVIIEDDVWVGMRAIILPGVRIGRSSVIGAGAVVAKDVPPFSIVAGNPAKVVKRRDVPSSLGTKPEA